MALFGCAPKRPLDYLGSAGLLWAINGGRLVELHRDWAVIDVPAAKRARAPQPTVWSADKERERLLASAALCRSCCKSPKSHTRPAQHSRVWARRERHRNRFLYLAADFFERSSARLHA